MPSILVQKLDLGLNALVSENIIDPRGAARGTENILYEYGIMRTPFGFAKVDLTTTGLNSGDAALSIMPYTEADRTSHLLAATTQKIYLHNRVAESWDDKTGTALSSDIFHPVSYTEIAHNDTDIYLNDNATQSKQYYHLIVCDGGMSNIQRWAGKYESTFHDVVGAGGYHDGTTHRALQVEAYKNRLILISPLSYNSSSKTWIPNKQRIQYPVISKLQTWTGTGSGFVDLVDTGGENIWSARLGSLYTIYQDNSIWDLGYVGGTRIFDPKPVIPELGLLAHHLLAVHGNAHYFVGSDYNVYVYYGGSIKQKIGDKIHRFLQEDLDPVYQNRCWMALGEQNRWLYIFIVPNGSVFITKAYIMNMATGAWSVRDFTNTFGSGDGVTAVSLVGSQAFTTGATYQEALDTLSSYDAGFVDGSTAGDVTVRYGDILCDNTSNALDWSTLSATADYDFSWKAGEVDLSAGGLLFSFCYENDPTKLIDLTSHADGTTWSGLILRISDGSATGDMPHGTHYYQLTDVCSAKDGATTDYSVTVHVAPRDSTRSSDSTGTGIADLSTDTPVFAGDTTGILFCPSGPSYADSLNEVLVDAKIFLGDATGFIYLMDETYATEDFNSIVARHITPVIDMGRPGRFKRNNKLSFTAKEKESGTGGIIVRFRTSNFDTSETGWINADSGNPVYDIESNCVGFWKLNDNQRSTVVADDSGRDHTGTASVNTDTISTEGKVGKCFDMASSAYVTVASHSDFNFGNGTADSPFSISVWVYVTASIAEQIIISKATTGAIDGDWALLLTDRKATFTLYDNAIGFVSKFTVASLSAGWRHIVATYDGVGGATAYTGMNIYIDSVLVTQSNTGIGVYTAMSGGTHDVAIGSLEDGTTNYADKIDNVMIFNKELSAVEAGALYSSGNGTEALTSQVFTLSSDWEEYDAYINRSSKRIQFAFVNSRGSDFEVREAELHGELEGNR
ncbi:hypothetical protein LCGC14_0638150 [marine sediment metagenome]|uniref:LamG-like jellyroll fold domain-containing protein n=1 Tax=marine sediment metagenome TaxID=412755 RepID=A0A0F9R593_9ZZZZ